jgi:heavy metal sensor kinase
VKRWWQRRSLKLRLAVWFTVVGSVTLLALIPAVYGLIEHRLHVELDRQLGTDWARAEAHLKPDDKGGVRWSNEGAQPPGLGLTVDWFDLWSADGQRLLSYWPSDAGPTPAALPALPADSVFQSVETREGLSVRTMSQPTRVAGRALILRVLRDESGIHHTLREILISFALAVPLIALLAAAAGYVTAGRMLRPLSAMAEHARQITSESLSQRLPVANAHDELGQLAVVFNQTLQRLQNSFDSLRRFTADASHELRTPLTALRTVGEVALRRSDDSSAMRESIGSMLEEAQRLNDLIDSLLLLARAEGGRSAVNLEAVGLLPFLAEVRESVAVLASEKGQTIDVDGEADVTAAADRLLTRQAVMNILYNAIRYSPTGARVVMRCYRRGGSALIEVADNGPGIAPEDQQRIFERFFRVDKARSRAEGGAGLGLAIARLSIEIQGGVIELESESGRGSCFRIVFPHQATSSAVAADPSTPSEDARVSSRPYAGAPEPELKP